MKSQNKISVIIPVTEKKRVQNISEIHQEYFQVLLSISHDFEMIYVIDGGYPEVSEDLKNISKLDERVKVIQLAKSFGEATAIMVGFEQSQGEYILILPAYPQVISDEISKFVKELENCDLVVGWRWPRIDSILNKFQATIFNRIMQFITEAKYHDLGCSVRALKRRVLEEIVIYGDQHRFLPLLADRMGFNTKEIKVKQHPEEAFKRIYSPGIYIRRILDLFSIFFLTKFTKKPLRFFGLSGFAVFLIGGILALYLAYERIFLHISLADRPLVLLSLLLIVLGIQIFAIGLLGEIIIFTHAKDLKEYTIEKVLN